MNDTVRLFTVIVLELLFLLISFVFIGVGAGEIKRKKGKLRNGILIAIGIIFAAVSIYCSLILLLY